VWKPAARAFKLGDFKPIDQLLAENAFFSFPKSFVVDLCGYWVIDVPTGLDYFDTLAFVCKFILKRDDQFILNILHEKMATMPGSNDLMAEELLQIDAAIQVLDQCDHDVFLAEQKKVEGDKEERREFAKRYRERISALTAGLPLPVILRPARRGGAPGGEYPPAIPSTIPHAEAALYIPPGSTIWRALLRSKWEAHVKPYPRFGEHWSIEGEHEALLRILRRMWAFYLEGIGRDLTDCPITGLFAVALGVGIAE
jgi:hypothetical protein